jgi:hypothetical protein
MKENQEGKMSRRRKSKPADLALTFIGGFFALLLVVILTVIEKIIEFLSTTPGQVVFGIGLAFAGWLYWETHKQNEGERLEAQVREQELQSKIAMVEISKNREDYIIEEEDYRRGNKKENLYRKRFKLTLLSKFGNACVKCGRSDNGVDIDHFVLSKNEGGCFFLRHRDGYLVNNAIVLCASCNRSKSDDCHLEFFTPEELHRVYSLNAEMTALLNEEEFLDELVKKGMAA